MRFISSCSIDAARGLAVARIDQIDLAALPRRAHELVRCRHRDVEVLQKSRLLLGLDELQDIGMIDPQDAHVRAPAAASLLDNISGRIEDAHEGYRAAGHSARGRTTSFFGPQPGEGEARASSALVDEGHVLQGVEDARQRVLHRKDEAGR